MKLTLKIWRQKNAQAKGYFETQVMESLSEDMSFLEMLDVLNERLIKQGKEPVAFDHDCREGICGACSLRINGESHGPKRGQTTCQIHLRQFEDGDSIKIEPFRARSFPIIKDLIVDRKSFDRIIEKGGYITVRTGSAPEAHSILVSKEKADESFASAACIGCGACVDACKNASAQLFVGAKLNHLASMPQGEPEKKKRALRMVQQMDKEGFGACSHTGRCEAVCPKEISLKNIAGLNKSFWKSSMS